MSKKTYSFGPVGNVFGSFVPQQPPEPKPQEIRIALGPVDTRMATRPPCNTCKNEEDKGFSQTCWECPRPVTQYQHYEPK